MNNASGEVGADERAKRKTNHIQRNTAKRSDYYRKLSRSVGELGGVAG